MAVVHAEGTSIAAYDAGTYPNSVVARSPLFETTDRAVPSAATLDATSILRLVRVPSNARLSSLELTHDAWTAGAGAIGVYYATGHAPVATNNAAAAGAGTFGSVVAPPVIVATTALDGGGAAIDKNFFTDAITFLAAGVDNFDGTGTANGLVHVATDVVKYNILSPTLSNSKNTMAKSQQPLWQAIGCATDPGGFMDICVTVTTQLTGVIEMSARARFTI